MKKIVILCRHCRKMKHFGEFIKLPERIHYMIKEEQVEVRYEVCQDCERK